MVRKVRVLHIEGFNSSFNPRDLKSISSENVCYVNSLLRVLLITVPRLCIFSFPIPLPPEKFNISLIVCLKENEKGK